MTKARKMAGLDLALEPKLQALIARDDYVKQALSTDWATGAQSAQVYQAKLSLLMKYLELIVKWNAAYNLTAIKDPEQMLSKHFLDCLSVGRCFTGETVLDVGTGAGFPGLVLAILFSHLEGDKPTAGGKQFTLLDSLGKRIQFLRHAVMTLGLKNVTIVHARVEDYESEGFDIVTSRAFTDVKAMTSVCAHLLKPEGTYLLLKGALAQQELEEMSSEFVHLDTTKLVVPGLEDSERYVVAIKRA